MADVVLKTSEGRPLTVPEEQVQEYVDRYGMSVASPELQEQVKLQEKFGGIGQAAASFGLGALSGATLTGSDIAIAELVPGGAEYLQGLRQYQAPANIIGQVGGGIAPLLIPGGATSLLARGGRLLGAPARAAFRAGEAASGAVGGGVRGLMTGAAVEGAALGIGSTVSEASIYDHELTGEMLAAGAFKGAALGGAGGLVLGGGATLLGKAGRGTANLITRSLRTASGEPGPAAYVMAKLSGTDEKLIAKFADEATLTRAKAAPQSILDLRSGAADDLERINEGLAQAERLGTGQLKREAVTELLPANDNVGRRTAAHEMMSHADDVIGIMRTFPDIVDNAGLKALQRDVNATRVAIKNSDDPGVFMALDNMKRTVGDLAYNRIGSDVTAPSGRMSYERLDRLYEQGLRPLLENKALWGAAADMQAAVNPKWKQFIETAKETNVGKLMRREYAGDKGETASAFQRDKVFRALSGLDGGDKKQFLEHLSRYLDDGNSFADEVTKWRAAEGPISTMGADVASTGKKLRQIQENEQLYGDFQELRKYSRDYDHALGFLGYAAAGLPGSIVAGSLRNPYGIITKLGVARSIASGVENAVNSSVGRLTAMATAASATQTALLLDAQRKRYESTVDGLRRYEGNKDAVRAELEDSFLGLSDSAPAAARKAVDTTTARMDFLLKNLPQDVVLSDGSLAPPDAEETRKFMRYVRALDNPGVIVDDILAGNLDQQTVDAISETYPAIYQHIRFQVAEEWGHLNAKGKKLPYEQRLEVGALLQIPTDVTMDPHLLNIIYQGYAAQPNPDAAPGPRPAKHDSPAQAYRTSSDRLVNPEAQ